MDYFDLHCHPFFKPTWLTGSIQDRLTNDIEIELDPRDLTGLKKRLLMLLKGQLKEILDAQSSLNQIARGGGKVVVANLIALESAYSNLRLIGLDNVLQYVKGVNQSQLLNAAAEQLSYGELTDLEWEIIRDNSGKPFPGFTYKLINAFDEIDHSDGVINVIAAIEGAHSLFRNKDISEQEKHPDEVISALVDWKQKTKTKERPRLLYITLTHHAFCCFANQAYAVPAMIAGDGISNRAGGFNPVGNGISEAGKKFIRTALRSQDENGKDEDRILIDIKHMSVVARRQFYKFRRELIAEGILPAFPILASHMGVTGQSWDDASALSCFTFPADSGCFEVLHDEGNLGICGFKVAYGDDLPNEGNMKFTRFNPWSINLYDEEIRIILESGGLIGLSFDSRILGSTDSIDRERFSKTEIWFDSDANQTLFALPSIFQIKFSPPFVNLNGREGFLSRNRKPTPNRTNYPETVFHHVPFSNRLLQKKHRELIALCQNIVHLIRIGGPRAWDQICIGSDYEGVINTIDYVPDASRMPELEMDFKFYLTKMVNRLNAFFNDEGNQEPQINVPPNFYEKFLNNNGMEFLKKHYKGTPTAEGAGHIPV